MQARFLHFSDCHLGYRQYGSKERFNDFTRAFIHIVNVAVAENVDFVVLAGDLFQKRSIDALTLRNAMQGLERLAAAGIPCITVEGNHEMAYYSEAMGWLRFLAERDLLILLTPTFEAGRAQLLPYTNRKGAYYEPTPGLRVYGLRYFGSGTARAVESLASALADQNLQQIDYTVLVAHTGVEGVLPGHSGGLSHSQLAPLRPHVDYLALGHVHKPFTFDNWIYNAGSPETCSMEEVAWRDRGYYLVDVNTERDSQEPESLHVAELHANPRRPFYRLHFKVDRSTSPEDLYERCRSFVARRAQDESAAAPADGLAPVVELRLSGVLAFDRSAVEIERLRLLLEEYFAPLLCQVKNATQPAEFAVTADEEPDRRLLERQIVSDLLDRDVRFRRHNHIWTELALELKRLALTGADPQSVLTALDSQLAQLQTDDVDQETPNPDDGRGELACGDSRAAP